MELSCVSADTDVESLWRIYAVHVTEKHIESKDILSYFSMT